jgi:hypothetical protein
MPLLRRIPWGMSMRIYATTAEDAELLDLVPMAAWCKRRAASSGAATQVEED